MRKIVLASSSPRRKELLSKTGLRFVVRPGMYEEDMTLALKPVELAKLLSRGKAESVAKSHKNAIVIGADTFVALSGEVLGKPHTVPKARAMLKKLSGKCHAVITGFAIIDTKSKKTISRAVTTKVYFKKLSSREINAYIKTGEPLERGGSYAIQGIGSMFVSKIEGDFFNVMGLPINALMEELKKFGISVF